MREGIKQSPVVVFAFLCVTTTAVAQNAPQDYPQWRGKNRDGAASAFSEPKSWPEKLTRYRDFFTDYANRMAVIVVGDEAGETVRLS